MSLQAVIEKCLAGLGYELVELEHGPGGLLRVYIDFDPEAVVGQPADGVEASGDATEGVAAAESSEPKIRIEDCERVSHQLGHVLAVDDYDYSRLEVSSPGLDRPLRKPAHFERFAGWRASVRLKRPLEGRRNFEGTLSVEGDGKFGLAYADEAEGPGRAPAGGARRLVRGRAAAKGRPAPEPTHKLVFGLDEIDKARLVPVLKF